MDFELLENDRVQLALTATTEEQAWNKLQKIGICNRSKILTLKNITGDC